MSVCQDEPLRLALEDYIVEQQESLDLVSGVLLPEEAESDFPFRFVGERTEFVRFVRALFITDRIVPVGGAKMLHCVRHLMRLGKANPFRQMTPPPMPRSPPLY